MISELTTIECLKIYGGDDRTWYENLAYFSGKSFAGLLDVAHGFWDGINGVDNHNK